MAKTRAAVVRQAQAWVGLKEADGSYKTIINTYNSKGPFPRGTKMQAGWAWCACTWSAIAKKLGYTDIMPVEISCYYIIEEAKKMGCWQEADGYTPKAGDGILYDWQDSGNGDNHGTPDHIGIVENVAGCQITVIEGNKADAVGRRVIPVNGKFIRGFITPKYDAEEKPSKPSGKKSVEVIAREVIDGRWGNGHHREKALVEAGYDYKKVQEAVNKLLRREKAQVVTVQKGDTVTAIAKRYGRTVKEIAGLNPQIKNINIIHIGDKIRVR